MTPSTDIKKPVIKTELPGPNAKVIIAEDEKYVTPSYPRPDYKLVAEKGYGVWMEDVDGNVFLDCNAGVAVCSTGHCHPEIVQAVTEQTKTLMHMCGTDYYYRHMPDLGRKLNEIVPIEGETKTHFANSGAEAVETALKLAMYHTKRQKFISFFGSFHGRTLGALSLTSSKRAQRLGFARQALDVTHVPYSYCFRCPFNKGKCDDGSCCMGTVDWIEDRLFKTTTPPEEVAGIVIEAVQGEGGYVPAPPEVLQAIRKICDKHGIMMIVDEVQSGMGRTGKMFAIEHSGVSPDIMCLAKGIGSGLPIGATVANAEIMSWHKGAHASTFGGNPVCIASALKTIELLEGGMTENAREVGNYLMDGLRKLQNKHKSIGDVRGLGLMVGVEFVNEDGSPNVELRDRLEIECFNRGLIILGCGDSTIRWSPPLILSKENVDVALEIFDQAIDAST
ncbi:MAG: acetyl ornithine aminotransferase family protein [Pyrinomonadaceae bacterium]|nr:acetyl ornithine aminotransferase family protein [Pyrinomonadaceae bacterium]